MKQQNGFSLIELMITIVIIGILASIAIPNYSDYVTRSRIPEATAGLGDIRVRMEQFFQDRRSYPTGGCITTAPAATDLKLQVSAGDKFSFSCTATATTYTVTATGAGPMAGFVYTIDQFNSRTTTITSVAGWSAHSPNNCWVTKKGGYC